MKKRLSFQNEVFVITMAHEDAVRSGTRLDMSVAACAVDELVALGARELARL